MRRQVYFATTLALALLVNPLRAVEIQLIPSADSTVDALNPDAVDNDGQLLASAVGDFNQPATTMTFVYTQFTLPDGMTGQDIGAVNLADLQFSRADPNTRFSLNYYAYGVFDGVDVGSANDYTWNDGIGYFPENTEIRNFGDPAEISYYSDAAESSFIGNIRSESTDDPPAPFGLAPVQLESAREAFRNLILNDTDGKITIYTKVRQNFPVTPLQPFESIEDVNEFTAPPTLILDIEEAMDLEADYNGDGVVNAADYPVWRDTLGSMTMLEADGNNNGVIDEGDYEVWKDNYGMVAGSGATEIPEPTSTGLVVFGACLFSSLFCRERRTALLTA